MTPHEIQEIRRQVDLAELPHALLRALETSELGAPIHWLGPVALCDRAPRVALIGTRQPSAESVAEIEAIAGQLASAGAVIVSGAAAGTDMAAHRGALNSGGPTIACLPEGIGSLALDAWRRDFRTFFGSELLLLLSPFGRRQPMTRQTPVVRNRLIAALAGAIVVGEAALGSGTHWCLRFALDYGVPVFLLSREKEEDECLALLHRELARKGARLFRPGDAYEPRFARDILRAAAAHDREDKRQDAAQLRLFDN